MAGLDEARLVWWDAGCMFPIPIEGLWHLEQVTLAQAWVYEAPFPSINKFQFVQTPKLWLEPACGMFNECAFITALDSQAVGFALLAIAASHFPSELANISVSRSCKITPCKSVR